MKQDDIAAKAKILVRRPRDDVFNAFIDPDMMSQFWFRREDEGLRQGETVTWFVGDAPDAFEIEVRVKVIEPPSRINIAWGHGAQFTNVTWIFEEHCSDVTRLVIEERGFVGSREEIVSQALDSTCGFNQVIVALKALLEHNATINIVADHI